MRTEKQGYNSPNKDARHILTVTEITVRCTKCIHSITMLFHYPNNEYSISRLKPIPLPLPQLFQKNSSLCRESINLTFLVLVCTLLARSTNYCFSLTIATRIAREGKTARRQNAVNQTALILKYH